MLYSLSGKIAAIDENMLALDCNGVAFACAATATTLQGLQIGTQCTVFTHLNVREDALELFAFATQAELKCFRQLIAITGVGPKAALALLSAFRADQLAFFVASGDAKSLTRAQGIGTKIAQRIVLELKDKLTVFPGGAQSPSSGNAPASIAGSDALAALLALGYDQSAASLALRGLDENTNTQDQIKYALKQLSRK
ncbi:MAG: Holliday junction branch migration protein RuvA [Oscillospiraceae bacterium]|jgi:Holliday junction DNA helicase RuvA|nr:Holliday junction branch migration protein RuvA [Oscillospiraceae bacterium]